MALPWEEYQSQSTGSAPWEAYKTTAPEPEKTLFQRVGDLSRGYDALKANMGAGLVRGAGSIGATLMRPFESDAENAVRRKQMDEGLQSLTGANPESFGYGAGKLGGELLGTAGVGSLFGGAAQAAKLSPTIVNALRSGGMTTGNVLPAAAKWLGARGIDAATRLGAGAAVGGASAGMVNPEDAVAGAAIGGAAPFVLQGAGKLGSSIASLKPEKQGKVLSEALGISQKDATAMAAALRKAPSSIVDNSPLTVSQALQTQGANTPAVKMLERTVAGGRSGDPLLQMYANQGEARLGALSNQGAQTYQGAAKEEATNVGNKLGSLLRTQATDEQAVNRELWERLNQRALREGTSIQLPIDDMEAAMSPLGRGSAEKGLEARRVLGIAKDIGQEIPDSILPTAMPKKAQQNLEQFIRSQGGMRTDKTLTGESRALSNKQTGTSGLINNKSGKDAQRLAETAYQRGFISEPDSGVLMQALQGRGGRNITAGDAVDVEQGWRAMNEAAMGDVPAALPINKAVPFAEAQRLRSSLGSMSATAAGKGSPAEATVLKDFETALSRRFDDAASGNLLGGESISPEFMGAYGQARDATRGWHEVYDNGDNIASILNKPYGKDYRLTGDEISNKLWHGGAGLAGDVSKFKGALNSSNYQPAMDAYQRMIMTDAASKTTAAGQFGSALPKYVESRMSGLQEALTPSQMKTLSDVARDIRNAEAAASVPGLRGSDTQAKIDRALSAGLLDSDAMKSLSGLLSFKGFGLESVRGKAAESVIKYKGDKIAELLANPLKAAKALDDAGFVKKLDSETLKMLRTSVLRASPILAAD
jgi:hypothetical protein